MSVETSNSSYPVGNFVKILRQRFFIDHTSDAKRFIIEEYTLIGNSKEGVTNIILQSTNFLPNLTIYDSDGEELPVMPNTYTRILIESWIDEAINTEKQELSNLLQQMQNHEIFLLWIKLPTGKELQENQVKIINFEYSASKESQKSDEITLNIFSPSDHTVFYIIKKPEDFDFKKQKIYTKDNTGKDVKIKSWKTKKQDYMYVTETLDSLSITSKPNMIHPIKLLYSFRPQRHIVSFPLSALALLTLIGFYMVWLQECSVSTRCLIVPTAHSLELLDKNTEIGIFIIAASLVLPRLINNDKIRHSMIMLYFIPIILAISLLI